MKKYSARATDPDDKVPVPVDGAQLAADTNPFVWALAVRWGSTIDTESQLLVRVPTAESF